MTRPHPPDASTEFVGAEFGDVISIADFRANGDLEVFEREMKPHVKKKGKK